MDAVNSKINALLEQLTRTVNDCGLPPAVVGLALDKIRSNVRDVELQCLIQEQKTQKENPQ